MFTNLSKARSVMVTAIKKEILPELYRRGFSEMPMYKESIPMWHLNRLRSDHGYDVISIIFDKRRRPLFDVTINIVSQSGIVYPWGESIPASNVTAITPQKRVNVWKRRKGILAFIYSYWFKHTRFGFKPQNNANLNQNAAKKACEEFIAYLEQIEHWWRTRELGPDLVEFDTKIILQDPRIRGGEMAIN